MLDALVRFSNYYGSNPELVLAGGGNTSAKDKKCMYVKGSGTSLATIKAEQFVKIDLEKLALIFEKAYPQSDAEREALVLEDLMASRAPGEEGKRPSVETTLHALFEQTYVLHLHPALVNGLTCSNGGEKLARQLFDFGFIWIDACKPGYILAKLCADGMAAYKKEKGAPADIIFLQNHGVFIADDTVDGLSKKLEHILGLLNDQLSRLPCNAVSAENIQLGERLKALCAGEVCEYITSADAVKFSGSAESAAPLLKPFTPDHIVYCKAYPLFSAQDEALEEKISAYKESYGFAPRIIIVEGEGIFCIGENEKQAKTAKLLFEDAIKVAVYSEAFGGALHMTEELTDFIVNWEVESYRSSQSK